MEYILGGKY